MSFKSSIALKVFIKFLIFSLFLHFIKHNKIKISKVFNYDSISAVVPAYERTACLQSRMSKHLHLFWEELHELQSKHTSTFSLHGITITNIATEHRVRKRAGTIYYQRIMFGFLFSAGLSEQRSALTTPLLPDVSQAFLEARSTTKKCPEVAQKRIGAQGRAKDWPWKSRGRKIGRNIVLEAANI